MNTGQRRTLFSYVNYTDNSVLKLIMFCGVAYVMVGMVWAIMMMVGAGQQFFNEHILANVGLPALHDFKFHWWTIFTYGWFHFKFWELFSNMLWLYCFGSVMQMLIGHKQVIPLYAYSLFAGGIFYMAGQLIPGGPALSPNAYMLGARAGLMGIAVAAFTISPGYKFYLTPTFRLSMALVIGIFIVLMVLGSGFYLPILLQLAAGGFVGFAYIKLLKAGYRPGNWMYSFYGRLERVFTPDENSLHNKYRKHGSSMFNGNRNRQDDLQKRIDDILDKINQKGFKSLSTEEKEVLMRAAQENKNT